MPKGLAGSGITLCRSFLHRQEHCLWLLRSARHSRSLTGQAHTALLSTTSCCSLPQGASLAHSLLASWSMAAFMAPQVDRTPIASEHAQCYAAANC